MSAEKHSNAHMRPMKSRPDSIEQAIAFRVYMLHVIWRLKR